VARLRFTRWVPGDLIEAIDWYDSKSKGLGDRFRAAVRAALADIEKSPELYPLAFPDLNVRFYRIRRFPYLILYRVEASMTLVISVRHGASNPEKWRQRAEQA
jgi:toxin ParE1/3/4